MMNDDREREFQFGWALMVTLFALFDLFGWPLIMSYPRGNFTWDTN
jgi:hypothetical protein